MLIKFLITFSIAIVSSLKYNYTIKSFDINSSRCSSLLSFSHESILDHIFYNEHKSEMVNRNAIELIAVKDKQQLVQLVIEKSSVAKEYIIKVT